MNGQDTIQTGYANAKAGPGPEYYQTRNQSGCPTPTQPTLQQELDSQLSELKEMGAAIDGLRQHLSLVLGPDTGGPGNEATKSISDGPAIIDRIRFNTRVLLELRLQIQSLNRSVQL